MYFNKLKIDGQFCCMTRNFSRDFFSIMCTTLEFVNFILGQIGFVTYFIFIATNYCVSLLTECNLLWIWIIPRLLHFPMIFMEMQFCCSCHNIVSIKSYFGKILQTGDIKVITVSLYCSDQSTLPSVNEVRPWKSSTITMSSADADWYISIT